MRPHEYGLTATPRLRPFRFVSVLSLALFGFALSPVGCVSRIDDSDGPDGSESGGSGPAGGTIGSDGGRTGAGGFVGSGGAGAGGRAVSSGGSPSGGAAGEPGTGGAASTTGGQGGESPICELPFDGGPCDAAIPVYSHNVQTGLCEPTVYGGCGGNENRFETLADCEQACDVQRGGIYCEVNGRTYPHGANVPDPRSCNTCTCEDGELTACSEADCPKPCPEGSLPATECAECGPTDACLTVRHTCLPECGPTDECVSGGWCNSGICRKNFCG